MTRVESQRHSKKYIYIYIGGEVHRKGKQNSSKEGGRGSIQGIFFSGLNLIFEKLHNYMKP